MLFSPQYATEAVTCSFYNVAALPAKLLKKKLRRSHFLMNLAECLRTKHLEHRALPDDCFCNNKISYSKLAHAN